MIKELLPEFFMFTNKYKIVLTFFMKRSCKKGELMVDYNGAWRIDRVAKEPHWKCGKA